MTVFRAFKLLALMWVGLFGLWLFFPAPLVPPEWRLAYIQKTLASGRSLITVNECRPFEKDKYTTQDCQGCTHLLFQWRFASAGADVLLQLDGVETRSDLPDTKINITGILNDGKRWNAKQSGPSGKKWRPYFTGALTLPRVLGGSEWDEIVIPWFNFGDQMLFHQDMYGFTAGPIVFRAVVPQPGTLEIWNSAIISQVKINKSIPENATNVENSTPEAWEQLYQDLGQEERDKGLLATFNIPDAPSVRNIEMKLLNGDLPPRTYPIRRGLLVLFRPMLPTLFWILGEIDDFIAPLFPSIVISLIVYVLYRLRKLVMRSRLMTRREEVRVWGPTGPVNNKSLDRWSDEENWAGTQRPQPARFGRRWKD